MQPQTLAGGDPALVRHDLLAEEGIGGERGEKRCQKL